MGSPQDAGELLCLEEVVSLVSHVISNQILWSLVIYCNYRFVMIEGMHISEKLT